MNKMHYALLIPPALLVGSLAQAQTAPAVPNVQTAETTPARSEPAPSSDPRGITSADSGSAIDNAANVDAMPQTGAHPPVIGKTKPAEPRPHERARSASQAGGDPPER